VRYGVIEQMRQQYPVPRCAGSWVCPPAVTMHGAKGLPRCALSKSPGTKRKYVPLTSVPERPLVRNGYRRSWLSAASRSVFTGSSVCARSSAFVCKQKRKFKATTNSTHNLPVAPNILDQDFSASEPNQAWCGDITYIATDEGWLYLAGLKDLFSGELVGYAMSERTTKHLVMQALFRAVAAHRPPAGLIHHTDRGSQGEFNRSSQHPEIREFQWQQQNMVAVDVAFVRR
jgi:putative transposase